MQATTITPEVLAQGLKNAAPELRERASLGIKEERIRAFLEQRGPISDETITLEDLEQFGFRSFSDMLPYLERLEEADLAHQLDQDDTKAFAPIALPPALED